MPWAKLDDGFPDHPKVAALSDKAFRVHVAAICYAAKHMTDGLIIPAWLRNLGATKKVIAELLSAHVWEELPGGLVIHDFLNYNPSRESIMEERRRKSEAGKAGAQSRWGTPPETPMAPAIAPVMAERIGGSNGPSRPVPSRPPDDSLRSSSGAVALSDEPWMALSPAKRDVFREMILNVGERFAFEDPGNVPEWIHICENNTAEDIRVAINACREANLRAWPGNIRKFLPKRKPKVDALSLLDVPLDLDELAKEGRAADAARRAKL